MTYGIKEFMMKSVLHIISLWAICLACASCSQEDISQPVSIDGDGQVKILYKIAGTSLSRATEDGWDGYWNENAITRVDLFVFHADNTLYKHLDTDDLTINPNTEGGYTVAETEKLTYSEATADKKYYMIANCPQLETASIEKLGDLWTVMINPNLDCDAYQSEGFVMDDEGDFITTGELSTLTFNLERAAVKIRLSVFGADGTSIIGQCSFRLHNYVSDGTYVLADAERYCINTGQSHLDMLHYEDWANIVLQYYDGDENIDKAIFYSYPNDWFDEDLLNADGSFKDPQIYAKDDLIDEDRQTYIMVVYKQNAYKVPVNFSIANDNDKYFDVETEEGKAQEIAYIKEIRDKYYRIKRNHIYDIKATIDIEANKIKVEHKILVNAWNEKGEMEVIFGDESNESN